MSNIPGSPASGQAPHTPAQIAAQYAPNRASLIPLLTEMQRVYGFLSEECLSAAAAHASIGIAEIRAAVTFYPHLRFTPPARHLVRVCQGTACQLRGAAALRDTVESILGVPMGGVTPDGAFALEPAACFGCCAAAPALAVGATVHGPVDAARARALLAPPVGEARKA